MTRSMGMIVKVIWRRMMVIIVMIKIMLIIIPQVLRSVNG